VNIFIAEDNPILLQGLERALTANGYSVSTAEDGQEMLQLLEGAALPDILLLDVMMPHVTGIEVLDAVRANPRTAHIPVMLITAAAEEVGPNGSIDTRDVEVLMKPFRLKDLLARIHYYVHARHEELPAAKPRFPEMPSPY
jgi:CheY-like chemotaxis protein